MRVGPDPLPGPYKKGNDDTQVCAGRGPPEIQKVATSIYQPSIAGNTRSWGKRSPPEFLEGTNPPNAWFQISGLQKQKRITLHCLKLPGLWSLVMAATGHQKRGRTGDAEEDGTVVPGLGGPRGPVSQASSSPTPARPRRLSTPPAPALLCGELGSLPTREAHRAPTLRLPGSPNSPAPGNPPASAPQRLSFPAASRLISRKTLLSRASSQFLLLELPPGFWFCHARNLFCLS